MPLVQPFPSFYINYEECKFFLLINNLSNSLSFILTMRNVNIIVNILSSFGVVGFILTMRNVNGEFAVKLGVNPKSFILTMRNVNEIE
ncbi:Uncharacterised protein [Clostridium perfringens]|nr:Uncharacterised protein [Clostridium perfringens]